MHLKVLSLLFSIVVTLFAADRQQATIDSLEIRIKKIETVLEYLIEGHNIDSFAKAVAPQLAQLKTKTKTMDSLSSKEYLIPIGQSPVLGDTTAPYRIVDFSDLECPFSYKVSQELQALYEKYPDSLCIIFKHFPLPSHPNAPLAHKALLAMQSLNHFWEYRFLLPLKYDQLSQDIVEAGAKLIGIRKKEFRKALNIVDTSQIAKDIRLGESIGVDGTPTIFVNGKREDHFSYASFVQTFLHSSDTSCNCDPSID